MNLRVKAWHLPPRLITDPYFPNPGLSEWGADHATTGQLHGVAAGTYPLSVALPVVVDLTSRCRSWLRD